MMFSVRMLNDDFRRTFQGGRVCMTRGVASLDEKKLVRIQNKVRSFDEFTEDNDPFGEHDFGAFMIDGESFFWKIDYYDQMCQGGSEDPSDPDKTTRVLTILKAEEW